MQRAEIEQLTSAETAKFPHHPSLVLGMAALVGLAYRQGDLAAIWSQLLNRFATNPTDAAALMDMSIILQATGQRSKALELQQMALKLGHCYARPHGRGDGVKILAFVAEGDFMANTPIDFLMEGSNAVLTTYYVDGHTPDLRDARGHDVAFIAVGESEANAPTLANLRRLLEGWRGPIMNGNTQGIAR